MLSCELSKWLTVRTFNHSTSSNGLQTKCGWICSHYAGILVFFYPLPAVLRIVNTAVCANYLNLKLVQGTNLNLFSYWIGLERTIFFHYLRWKICDDSFTYCVDSKILYLDCLIFYQNINCCLRKGGGGNAVQDSLIHNRIFFIWYI